MMKDGAPEARVKIWREAPPSFDIRYSLFIIRYSFLVAACPHQELRAKSYQIRGLTFDQVNRYKISLLLFQGCL